MSMWLDDLESEAWNDSEGDYDGEADIGAEADYDSEGDYDGEASRSSRDRRERARRLVAQRRMEQARLARASHRPGPLPARPMTGPPATTQAAATRTVRAIRDLDLETKVRDDSLRREIDRLKRQMERNSIAFALSQGVDQGLDSFGDRLAGHEFIRAGIRLAPALLVASPGRRRRGLEGYLLDPRVLSVLAVGGVLAAGKLDHRSTGVDSIQIAPVSPFVGDQGQLLGVAVDRNGNVRQETITWASQNSAVLAVTSTGAFTANAAGTALVTATAGGVTNSVFITVEDPDIITARPAGPASTK